MNLVRQTKNIPLDETSKAIPFLKWAGGKRWLIKSGKFPRPESYNRFIEPFLGSGAAFFYMLPEKAILSDINRELIETYKAIRDDHKSLIKTLSEHQDKHDKEYYYYLRSKDTNDVVASAARFIYLNRTCWNGLYRVNKNGKFNVPIGTRNSITKTTDNFLYISNILKKAKLEINDFEETINKSRNNDFLFVDPPYTVKHNSNNFIKYNEIIFSWEDQIRLKECLLKAKARGVKILMTNAAHECIKELYSEVGNQIEISRASCLASCSQNRKIVSELVVIANYQPYP